MDNIRRSPSPSISKKDPAKEIPKKTSSGDHKDSKDDLKEKEEDKAHHDLSIDERAKKSKPEVSEEERSRVKKLHLADLQQKQVEYPLTRTKKYWMCSQKSKREIEKEQRC